MSKRTVAIVGLVVVMSIWGSSFAITKAALSHMPPLSFALLRFLVASGVLCGFCYPRRQHLSSLLHSGWLTLLGMGLTGITLYYVGYQFGLVYGSATQGAFIQAIIPAATAIAAVAVLHEQLSKHRMVGIGVSLLGVMMVILAAPVDGVAPRPVLGALFMAGSVLAWALYTGFAKRLAHADVLLVTTVSTIFGTILLCPFVLAEMQTHSLPPLTLGDRWVDAGDLLSERLGPIT